MTLRGYILASELDTVLSHVASIQGVKSVKNELEAHSDSKGVSSLQGGVPRSGENWNILQPDWAPATRFMIGTVGARMFFEGIKRRGGVGAFLNLVGIGIITRAYAKRTQNKVQSLNLPETPSQEEKSGYSHAQ